MIGNNIRNLRRAYGETQKELAEAINVAENTISMYEHEERTPDIEKIQAIARHYGISIERVMTDDLSQINIQLGTLTWDEMIETLEILFPIVCSDFAMRDNHFQNGYNQTKEILKRLKTPYKGIMSRAIERALIEYETSLINNSQIVEAAANMIWLIIINYALMPDEHSTKMGEAILYGKALKPDFVKKYVLVDSNPISKENAKNKKMFIKDNQEVLMVLIRILKESTDYSSLADYYLGVRYLIGMIDNGYSDELNKTIGMELLTSYAELGNKYVINMFRKVYSL